MAVIKEIKDYIVKLSLGSSTVPKGLYDSREYFRLYGPIYFENIQKDGYIVAKSTNFHWGSIITEGKDAKDLDENVRDAILTAFGIPSSYAEEASIKKVGSENKKKEYAIA